MLLVCFELSFAVFILLPRKQQIAIEAIPGRAAMLAKTGDFRDRMKTEESRVMAELDEMWKPYSVKHPVGAKCLPEVLNGVDDDCDYTVDEGFACESAESRSCGIERGSCETGTQKCLAGRWSSCLGGKLPGPATRKLDPEDSDCDGVVGGVCVPGTSEPCCLSGLSSCILLGVTVCDQDGFYGPCVAVEFVEDKEVLCNRIDDDFDGLVDEGC